MHWLRSHISNLFYVLYDFFFSSKERIILLKTILALITFIIYWWMFSWKTAIFMMIMIGAHELGHCYRMKRVGVGSFGFFFIPLIGGVSGSLTEYKSSYDKAIVALEGVAWGTCLAIATLITYRITGSLYLGVAAFWQAVFNIFNLIPISVLDGGRVVKIVISSIKHRYVFPLLSKPQTIKVIALYGLWLSLLVLIMICTLDVSLRLEVFIK